MKWQEIQIDFWGVGPQGQERFDGFAPKRIDSNSLTELPE